MDPLDLTIIMFSAIFKYYVCTLPISKTMGEQIVDQAGNLKERTAFIQHLINDISALELLLCNDAFEDDTIRIGAEQEICLINEHYRPMGANMALLDLVADDHFTTELASYNIEINLDPVPLTAGAFAKVEAQLRELMKKGGRAANKVGAKLLLAGILPTIGKNEVSLEYLTPIPRYFALNQKLTQSKGSNFNLKIRGVDELFLKHDSVMFEACNTSFQLHLQIPSHDFISSYNWAQAIAGPVLSLCCNSPLLMGRELWKETRIALFQQSLDTRRIASALRNQSPRVGFGTQWETGSVAEIFKKDISHHKVLLTKPIKKSSLEQYENGEVPELQALRLHNGTVYRWNRPCYGIGGGKPHLRIENRYIPAGPSILDEMANFAFWVGLMMGRPKQYDDMPAQMDFKFAKANFIKAARTGQETVFHWMGQQVTAKDLILNQLLPMARSGLEKCNIAKEDIDRLLDVVQQRIHHETGDAWQVNNFRSLKHNFKTDRALVLLTKAMCENQEKELPVHLWPKINCEQDQSPHRLVKEVMTTHLYKLHEEDTVAMAAAIMKWNNIHHIPVEDAKGRLTGLLTWTYLNELGSTPFTMGKKVSDVMVKKVITTEPEAMVKDALQLMEKNGIGCLPVCMGKHLVGIMSKKDVANDGN
jgi:CBS domain-containing protein/gamma-glutamyl:cysteine ligase YbdK (ATP-grasp superfamily)